MNYSYCLTAAGFREYVVIFFEYVDVLEQEKAIGIKKKKIFFFRAHCQVVARTDPLWSGRARMPGGL
jgi:hypothetical protein